MGSIEHMPDDIQDIWFWSEAGQGPLSKEEAAELWRHYWQAGDPENLVQMRHELKLPYRTGCGCGHGWMTWEANELGAKSCPGCNQIWIRKGPGRTEAECPGCGQLWRRMVAHDKDR
jgi:hypothetical protein